MDMGVGWGCFPDLLSRVFYGSASRLTIFANDSRIRLQESISLLYLIYFYGQNKNLTTGVLNPQFFMGTPFSFH